MKMKQTLIALACLVTLLLVDRTSADRLTDAPPNIIFIMADDLGLECVSAYSGEMHDTPNIDRLAKQGMRFDYAFSAPACSPTRAQLLTGLYPFGNGIAHVIFDPAKHQAYLDPSQFQSFASVLKQQGYATAMAGKWQLSFLQDQDTVRDFGFDEYLAWQIFDGKDKTSRFFNPTLRHNGKTVTYTDGEYGPDLLRDFSIDFIRRNKDQPFCLYYAALLPHFPFSPTPDSEDQAQPIGEGQKGDPKFFPDMVTYLDKIVGQITDEVDRLGLGEDTVIIFTGDNGTDQILKTRYKGRVIPGGKGQMLDTAVRVPFVVRQTGRIKPGSTCSAMIDFTDVLPTFADIAGASVPEGLHGKSFAKLLDNPTLAHRDWIFYEYLGKQAIRTRHATLVDGGKARINDALGLPTKPATEDVHRELAGLLRQIVDGDRNALSE